MKFDENARLSENVEVACGGSEGTVKLQDASAACIAEVVEGRGRAVEGLAAIPLGPMRALTPEEVQDIKAWEAKFNRGLATPAMREMQEFVAKALRFEDPNTIVLTNPYGETGTGSGGSGGAGRRTGPSNSPRTEQNGQQPQSRQDNGTEQTRIDRNGSEHRQR